MNDSTKDTPVTGAEDSMALALQQMQKLSMSASPAPSCFFAPARINLIGEHIDYCGGLVLPAAISFGTSIAARRTPAGMVRVISGNQPGLVEFDPNQPNQPVGNWGDYVVGVFEEYRNLGIVLPGLDISICGNIPGSCLSSSASLGVGIATMIEAMAGHMSHEHHDQNRKILAQRVQHAENSFVGVNCGIMDQAAVACGREGHAMLLDCSTLAIRYIPVSTGRYRLVIADTRKDRSLVTSAYNQRRAEVDEALDQVRKVRPADSLCDLAPADLQSVLPVLSSGTLRQRVRHVVTENHRVQLAAQLLQQNKLVEFARELNASHDSLRTDYEVTGPELDTLVRLIREEAGVLGARMMGAGFGGCGIALVEADAVNRMVESVSPRYKEVIGYEPAFHPVVISDGAREISRS